jgi:hypothetical protein
VGNWKNWYAGAWTVCWYGEVCRMCRLGLRPDEVELRIADGAERPARLVDGRAEPLDEAVVRRFGFERERRRFDEDDVRRDETGERVLSS